MKLKTIFITSFPEMVTVNPTNPRPGIALELIVIDLYKFKIDFKWLKSNKLNRINNSWLLLLP
jgi:hypothetical protein